jgi:hypothetical protein
MQNKTPHVIVCDGDAELCFGRQRSIRGKDKDNGLVLDIFSRNSVLM